MRGSIEKRTGHRGTSWYAKFAYTDAATGKRVHRRLSAPTRKECEARLREAVRSAEGGTAASDDRTTLGTYLDDWLKTKERTVRPATHRRYADSVRLHIKPVIGGLRLSKLGPRDLDGLYANRLAAGLGNTSVHHLHVIIHGALAQAMRRGLVQRNVSEMVDALRRNKPETAVWDAGQTAAFLEAGDSGDLAALWRLALLTGMRRGEMLGLRWDDVDLERGTLAVRRTLSRGNGGTWELGEPKTAMGKRSIALPPSCVSALRKHRAAQNAERLRIGPLWQDHGFVFVNHTGGPLHVNSLDTRYRGLIKASGVPVIRFHDLRHTCATLLLAAGVHPKVVQERLGHANIRMTLDRYSHVIPGMQRHAADALDAAIEAARRAAS